MSRLPAPAGNPFTESLSQPDFTRIANVIRREAGIELPPSKLPLVQSRLLRRLRALRLPDFSTYCDIVESGDAGTERDAMLSALTTNVTGFFRERHHFEAIEQHRLPDLANRLQKGDAVRVWSAGCSSGEEPYSLALTFLQAMPDIGKRDFRILATDIDPAILAAAAEGIYHETALTGVPAEQRAKHFRPTAMTGRVQVSDSLRELVVFRRLNLIDSWPLTRAFDIIMCRNVVIYFGDDTKADVWSRLIMQLQPDGWLLTGHSERLTGPASADMELVATTTYIPVAKTGASIRNT